MKFLYLAILLISNLSFSQEKTKIERYEKVNWNGKSPDLKMNSLSKKVIVPSALMVAGLSLNTMETKTKIQDKFRAPFNGYTTSLDDYIQYAPIATMYAFDLAKIPARNNVWNQTKYLLISELVTSGIVHLLKNTTKIARPNSNTLTSFPSGHTGQAFVASQVLFNEFYRTRPILGLSGYVFAGATGALRVVNNRHWVPDVLMGAGIAILVTNLVYHFEPLKNWDPFKTKDSDLSIMAFPQFRPDTYGMQINIGF